MLRGRWGPYLATLPSVVAAALVTSNRQCGGRCPLIDCRRPGRARVMSLQGRWWTGSLCDLCLAVAYLEHGQDEGDNPQMAHFVTLRPPGRKDATGAHCAAGRLQEKFEGTWVDGALEE